MNLRRVHDRHPTGRCGFCYRRFLQAGTGKSCKHAPDGDGNNSSIRFYPTLRRRKNSLINIADAYPIRFARFKREIFVERAVERDIEPGIDCNIAVRIERGQEIRRIVPISGEPDHRPVERDHLAHQRHGFLYIRTECPKAQRVRDLRELPGLDIGFCELRMQDLVEIPKDPEHGRCGHPARFYREGYSLAHDLFVKDLIEECRILPLVRNVRNREVCGREQVKDR